MDVRKLSDAVSVAPQLSVREIAEAARLGFRTLINNRPDGEDFLQPSARELEAAAREQGLEYHHLPVVSGALTERDVHAFRALLAQARATRAGLLPQRHAFDHAVGAGAGGRRQRRRGDHGRRAGRL